MAGRIRQSSDDAPCEQASIERGKIDWEFREYDQAGCDLGGMRIVLIVLLCALAVSAAPIRPGQTYRGKLKDWKGPGHPFRVVVNKAFTVTCRLTEKPTCYKNSRKTSANSFREGEEVVVHVPGAMEEIRVVDILSDPSMQEQLVAHTASAPSFTRTGDYATTGGTATRPPIALQDPTSIVGIIGNGGGPHLNRGAAMASVLQGIEPGPVCEGIVLRSSPGATRVQLTDGTVVTVPQPSEPGTRVRAYKQSGGWSLQP